MTLSSQKHWGIPQESQMSFHSSNFYLQILLNDLIAQRNSKADPSKHIWKEWYYSMISSFWEPKEHENTDAVTLWWTLVKKASSNTAVPFADLDSLKRYYEFLCIYYVSEKHDIIYHNINNISSYCPCFLHRTASEMFEYNEFNSIIHNFTICILNIM